MPPKSDSAFLRVLCLGDIVARPGRELVQERAKKLRQELKIDLLIANGENASGGSGLDPESARELFDVGIDVITLGDHVWRRKELKSYLQNNSARCIRPANYGGNLPGQGWTIWTSPSGVKVGIMNLLGRIFMNFPLDCPFRGAEAILNGPLKECPIRILDFHAEATSEKIALGKFLDGRLSLLVGTHTHVHTADERIFANGTGFVSDLGMCGSTEGVIGLDTEVALERFLTGISNSYQPATGAAELHGVMAVIDTETGKTVEIRRVEEK